MESPDPSHPVSAFGCFQCHLGNPHSLDKKRAHYSMVLNPGDLRFASETCGRGGCHSEIVPRVKNSIMATNRGIIRTLNAHWPEGSIAGIKAAAADGPSGNIQPLSVIDLIRGGIEDSAAMDHYSKMCGGCHLWKKRGDRPGEIGKRGGGCSDCHVIDDKKGKELSGKDAFHPKITTRIPSDNCVKCHNRSARIGLSYFGQFESAGYGTPYQGEELDSRRLSGNRFYMNLEPDIHFSKARMECVDCHTATGVMGDGNAYDKMEDQLDITCESCHLPKFIGFSKADQTLRRLVNSNRKIPWEKDVRTAVTLKGTPLYNLQNKGGKIVFYRKLDGHPISLDVELEDKSYHSLKGHERLSCQACHSAWVPQCYGCHITYDKEGVQRSWLDGRAYPGSWKEARSFQRFSGPALGLRKESRVFPASPCQVFVSALDKGDGSGEKELFRVLTMSFFDPHTTVVKSRECVQCHGDPKTIGLGEGLIRMRGGKLDFRPTYDSMASGLGMDFPIDGYVNVKGEQLQTTSRGEARPFNAQEINAILRVNKCLGCHDGYDDFIYKDFSKAVRRFQTERDLPCKK
jgi:hypothetical protein